MDIISLYEELTSTVSAAKMFKATITDVTELCPKLMPEVVLSASIVEGDGGVGSIKQFHFIDGAMPFNYLKERVDVMDLENLECIITLIESVDVGKELEGSPIHIKVDPAGHGGCVYKITLDQKSLPGAEDSTKHLLQAGMNLVIDAFKTMEAYIIANPNYE